jgi:enoyl-CoA hydratase/carnithine racemase
MKLDQRGLALPDIQISKSQNNVTRTVGGELLNSNASLEQVAEVQSRLFKTADAFEGMRAFLEKRKPVFTGS